MKLTDAQRSFLRNLLEHGGAATSREIGPVISSVREYARRSCRKLGYASFDRHNHCWRITDAGRRALAEQEGKKNG
jgi:hypothetical protein